jgi:FkbM family methyltransferase
MKTITIYKLAQKAKRILPLRVRSLLRKVFSFKILYGHTVENIFFRFNDQKVNFTFIAPPKISIKAKEMGIESAICRSIYDFSKKSYNHLILDIGMNYGFLSLAWSKGLPSKEIIGFEVHPNIINSVNNAAQLSEIVNLKIINRPVSNVSEQNLDFSLGIYTGSKSENNSKSITLKSITIDEFIKKQNKKVCAIKIDTDGFDYDCLFGSLETIKTHRPLVVIETNNDKRILDFFDNIDYFVYDGNFNLIDFSATHDLQEDRFDNLFAYPEKIPN